MSGYRTAWRAAAWIALSVCSFLALAMAARALAPRMAPIEMLFFRSVIGVALLAPLVLRARGAALATRRPGLHLVRNLVHFAGQYGWTVGVTLLPLAEVFALEFTTPIWLALIAALVLGEPLHRHRAIAVVGGFVGVLMVVRPGIAVLEPASLLVLGAAFSFACSVAMVKALTRTERAVTIVFYMALLQTPMALLPSLGVWTSPQAGDWPALLVMGFAGLTAHYGMARALMLADAAVVAPMDFVRLPTAALVGYAIYGEPIEAWTLVGATVIFAANYQAIRHETRGP